MIGLIFILLAAQSAEASHSAPGAPVPRAVVVPPVTCPPSAEETERLLKLASADFDQNLGAGWRPYASAGCYDDAARLILAYIDAHPSAKVGPLRFHRFQMLAFAGDTNRALAVLAQVERDDVARNADAGWRMYVAGTRAFVENRKTDLEAHLAELLAFAARHGPTERNARLNANVLQGFVRCFGKPYAKAYGPPCADLEAARRINAAGKPPLAPPPRQ